MKNRKKIIFNGVFLAVVFALTIYGVFHGEDLSSMMDAIYRADKRWLLPGIALVAFFIWGESIIIWYRQALCIKHIPKPKEERKPRVKKEKTPEQIKASRLRARERKKERALLRKQANERTEAYRESLNKKKRNGKRKKKNNFLNWKKN